MGILSLLNATKPRFNGLLSIKDNSNRSYKKIITYKYSSSYLYLLRCLYKKDDSLRTFKFNINNHFISLKTISDLTSFAHLNNRLIKRLAKRPFTKCR